MHEIITAFSFFTRFSFAQKINKQINEKNLSKALAWLPFVGLVLGLLCVAPAWLGLFKGKPLIQACLAVCLSVYCTRALHFDGLADICDGVAAHAEPERFWKIIKDSHIGTFGAIALILSLVGQVLLLSELFAHKQFEAIVWCFAAGRLYAVILGFFNKQIAKSGLGSIFVSGLTVQSCVLGTVLTLLFGLLFLPVWHMLTALIFAAVLQLPLYFLARKVQGINGDFLGASIVLGECGVLAGFVFMV